jgi:hypothetical protein
MASAPPLATVRGRAHIGTRPFPRTGGLRAARQVVSLPPVMPPMATASTPLPALTRQVSTIDGVAPFQQGPQPSLPGFWAKLFGGRPRAAQQALVNRLASAPIHSIGPGEVSTDLSAYGVRGRKARGVLHAVWRQAVEHFLTDEHVSDAEARYLAELRRILGLTEPELQKMEEELVHSRFGAAVKSAIADDHLSLSERSRLDDLAKALPLPTAVSQRILDRSRQERLTDAAKAAIADQRLSPTEVADLHALARSLGVALTMDAETQATMDRLSLLWRIENGQPPVYSVPINLQRGETCHAVADAVWLEMRTRTVRTNYSGLSTSIRICKGVRYRVGTVRAQRITRDELTEIDRGRLYVTNKRVIFDGAKKNSTIRRSGLLAFTPFADGVVLEKASGKPSHLLVQSADMEVFHATLGAVLAQSE